MGCRHYFVAVRLEELVDEGDSRSSSRVREQENFRLVSQLNVAIQKPWVDVYLLELGGLMSTNGSSRSDSICIYVFVCVFVFIWTFNRQLVFLQSREKRVAISWALERVVCCLNKSSCSPNWTWVWLVWLGAFCFVEQLLNPFPSSNRFSRKSSEAAEVTCTLSRIWLLQFPSWLPSGYNRLGVYCKG